MKKSQIAGVLLLLSFLSSLLEFVRVMFIEDMWEDANSGSEFAGLAMLAVYMRLFFLILSIIILVGAISALFRKSFVVSMVGALIGLLSAGFYFTSNLLAIASIILLIMAREEFDDTPGYRVMTSGYPQAPSGSFPPPPVEGTPPELNVLGSGSTGGDEHPRPEQRTEPPRP